MSETIDTADSKEQKRIRQENTALVFDDVMGGANVFHSIQTRNLHEHSRLVLLELVRNGNLELNTTIANTISMLPLAQRIDHTIDCFEHALHTKQPTDVCTLWRDALLCLAPRAQDNSIKKAFLNGLKVCAVVGNISIGNELLQVLLASKNSGIPESNDLLDTYFKSSINDPASIENICTTLTHQLNMAQHLQGMAAFISELHTTIDKKPTHIGRKSFQVIVKCLPAQYTPVLQEIVWKRCLKWCSPMNYSYNKSSIDYMLYYASQNGTAHTWNNVTQSIKANFTHNVRSVNYPAVETALDLLQRMMTQRALMDQYCSMVRDGLREVFGCVDGRNFTSYRDREVWTRIENIYAALEKSELLQHVGHTHESVSGKKPRKM